MGLLTTEAKNALQSGQIHIGRLAEIDFSFGTERYWDGLHPLSYDGETWTPTGQAGKMTNISSSRELRANGVTLTVYLKFSPSTNKPEVNFQNITPSDYKNRTARTLICFFDSNFQNIIYAHEAKYKIDSLNYNIDPKKGAVIQVRLESELLAAGKRQVKRLTDTQQRDDYPGDLGLQFLTYLSSGVEIKWGQEGAFFK